MSQSMSQSRCYTLRSPTIRSVPGFPAHEARLPASLNHPNIGSVYGFEQQEGFCALGLELIEGQTLLDRIHREIRPADNALVCAGGAERLALQNWRALCHFEVD